MRYEIRQIPGIQAWTIFDNTTDEFVGDVTADKAMLEAKVKELSSDYVRGLCRYCGARRVVGVETRCGCTGSQEAHK